MPAIGQLDICRSVGDVVRGAFFESFISANAKVHSINHAVSVCLRLLDRKHPYRQATVPWRPVSFTTIRGQ